MISCSKKYIYNKETPLLFYRQTIFFSSLSTTHCFVKFKISWKKKKKNEYVDGGRQERMLSSTLYKNAVFTSRSLILPVQDD